MLSLSDLHRRARVGDHDAIATVVLMNFIEQALRSGEIPFIGRTAEQIRVDIDDYLKSVREGQRSLSAGCREDSLQSIVLRYLNIAER